MAYAGFGVMAMRKFLISGTSVAFGAVLTLILVNLYPTVFLKKINFENYIVDKKIFKNRAQLFEDLVKKQMLIRKEFNALYHSPFATELSQTELREEMQSHIERHSAPGPFLLNPFDYLFADKFGGHAITGVTTREDTETVFYEIGLQLKKIPVISTKIEGAFVTVIGSIQKNNSEKYLQRFIQTLPVPDGTDASRMQVSSEVDRVTLKFPKF